MGTFFFKFFFSLEYNSLYKATNFHFHFIYRRKWLWKSVHTQVAMYEVGKPNYFVVSVPIKLFIQMFRFNQLISFDLCQSAIISAGWEVVFIITNLWFRFFCLSSLSIRFYTFDVHLLCRFLLKSIDILYAPPLAVLAHYFVSTMYSI